MRMTVIVLAIVLCILGIGAWWLFYAGTGTVDDGVVQFNAHQPEVKSILAIVQDDPALEAVWTDRPVSQVCSSYGPPKQKLDCEKVYELLGHASFEGMNADHQVLLWIFRDSVPRPPIYAAPVSYFAIGLPRDCKKTAMAGWLVCLGKTTWL
jgi:hypothetical protein